MLYLLKNVTFNCEISDGGITFLTENFLIKNRTLPYYVLVNPNDYSSKITLPDGCCTTGPFESFLIPPGTLHDIEIKPSSSAPVSVWCHFNLTLFNTIDLLSFFYVPQKFDPELSALLRQKCSELVAARNGSLLTNIVSFQKQALELADLIISGCKEREDAPAKLREIGRLQPALDYIKKHCGKDFSLRESAEKLSLSVSRFSAVFKNIIGIPPAAYRQKIRLSHAYEVICSGKTTIKECALHFGFYDEFHFSRSFKSHFGITPAQLQRIISQQKYF